MVMLKILYDAIDFLTLFFIFFDTLSIYKDGKQFMLHSKQKEKGRTGS